jgi:hypothetical protein|nr:MAG TPA: CENP-C-like protein [Caudoviricetes sp.]
MNKYILGKRNTVIKLNTDTLDVDCVETSYDIDRMWFIEEDGVLVRENKEYEVKKGDIVLLMYRIGGEKKEDPIIINNDDLSNYHERKKEFLEKERNRLVKASDNY